MIYRYLLKTLCLEAVLLCVCYLGDNVLQNTVNSQLFRAASDSLTHGLIGAVSWSIVCDIQLRSQDMVECLSCLLLASLVDVDHFLAARSLSLKDALSLPSRPPFHATTLILAVDVVMSMLMILTNSSRAIKKLILIFTVAWTSHHIRDASRRGLWLYPFGETPPLSGLTYHGLIVCLPLVFHIFHAQWLGNRELSVSKDNLVYQV